MRYFFSLSGYPEEAGFELFDKSHLIMLGFIVSLTIVLSKIYVSVPRDKRRNFGIWLTGAILLLEIGKTVYLLANDSYMLDYLPLHLCGISIFIAFINALWPGELKKEMLFCLVMPGAAAALIFPAWAGFPMLNIVSIQNFLQHALLMIYPILLLNSKEIRPDIRNLPECFIFMIVTAVPLYVFNKLFDTNFFFMNTPAPGSPIELLEKWFGDPWYIAGLGLLLLVVWTFLYVPVYIFRAIKKI